MDDRGQQKPRFVTRDGEVDGLGNPYNQTKVDVVLVPCPGADPHKTWAREYLPQRVFESDFTWHEQPIQMGIQRARQLTPEMFSASQRMGKSTSWTQTLLRKEVNFARILSYDHGEILETTTIKQLAENILRLLASERNTKPFGMEYSETGHEVQRPMFFICHSLGGLVVKLALIEARRNFRYKKILDDCYGVTFFATPHRSSFCFSTTQPDARIQQLLGLSKPLPQMIRAELWPGHALSHYDDIFKEVVMDIHIWTLYEMSAIQVSSYRSNEPMDAQEQAQVVSMKSAILGLRHEELYPLRSSHANCASFGMENYRTMRLYLRSLGDAIRKAQEFHEPKLNRSLNLERKGLTQVHRFHNDFEAPRLSPTVRVAMNTLEQSLAKRTYYHFGIGERLTSQLVWIHQYFNNPAWVRRIFSDLIHEDALDVSQLFNSNNWTSKQEGHRRSQPHGWFMKPSCAFIPPFVRPSNQPADPDHPPSSGSGIARSPQGCIYLYMPFLHFDTYRGVTERRRLIKRRLFQGLKKPVPRDVDRSHSLELKMIWEYLGEDPPINIRRTLDQFQHPSLPDTKARDDDQVLYKMTKERVEGFAAIETTALLSVHSDPSSGDDDFLGSWTEFLDELETDEYQLSDDEDVMVDDDILNGSILMVDQLWLWAFNESNVVTCFPRREEHPMDGPLFNEADLHDSIYNGALSTPCENALELAALIVLHAVTVLLGRSSNPDLEVFRIFEEAISLLTERMTRLLKLLEASAWDDALGFGDNLTSTKMPIHERHKLENARARRENRINTSTLLALRDIEDELSILKRLFSEQEQQIRKMLSIYESMRITAIPSVAKKGESYLHEALAAVESYQARTDDMTARTRKVLLDFDRLLDLLERRAQGEEGRLSRHHADLGAAQNRTVLIFTIFTVIFLPLSFFTSLFGMNTREWGGGDNLNLRTIGLIALPTSAVFIAGAIIIAWVSSGTTGYASVRRWRKKYMNLAMGDANGRVRNSGARKRSRQENESQDQRRRREQMKKAMTMIDIWDNDRSQKQYDDEIPLENRRGVRIAMARAKAMKGQREG